MVLEKSIKDETVDDLNKLIIKNVEANATKRHINAQDSKREDLAEVRSNEKYVSDINDLSHLLINIHNNLGVHDLLKDIIENDEQIESKTVNKIINKELDEDMISYIEDMLEML